MFENDLEYPVLICKDLKGERAAEKSFVVMNRVHNEYICINEALPELVLVKPRCDP